MSKYDTEAERKAYRSGYAAGNAAKSYRRYKVNSKFVMLPVTAPPETKVLFVVTQELDGQQMYRIALLEDLL